MVESKSSVDLIQTRKAHVLVYKWNEKRSTAQKSV